MNVVCQVGLTSWGKLTTPAPDRRWNTFSGCAPSLGYMVIHKLTSLSIYLLVLELHLCPLLQTLSCV